MQLDRHEDQRRPGQPGDGGPRWRSSGGGRRPCRGRRRRGGPRGGRGRNRDESRGAHYKPAFPKRDDENFQRTTLAKHEQRGAVTYIREFDYECAGERVHVTDQIDTSLVKPRERKYEQAGAASAEAQKK